MAPLLDSHTDPHPAKNVFFPRVAIKFFPNSPKCLRIGPGIMKTKKKFIWHTWTTMMLCTQLEQFLENHLIAIWAD